MKTRLGAILLLAGLVAGALVAGAPPARISIEAGKLVHKISPMLWGVFFEDINLSADGGIYPELVRNRSFEDADGPEFWKFGNAAGARGDCAIDSLRPLNPANRKSLRIRTEGAFKLWLKCHTRTGLSRIPANGRGSWR